MKGVEEVGETVDLVANDSALVFDHALRLQMLLHAGV